MKNSALNIFIETKATDRSVAQGLTFSVTAVIRIFQIFLAKTKKFQNWEQPLLEETVFVIQAAFTFSKYYTF